ncbi:signal peptidase I [Plantactinospora siamensis]|uniref:Signal peptidase I n=1 Tax=Plantactinospora siamensis TaxID=555372 RepID=A0ABV6NTX5_9ACTN
MVRRELDRPAVEPWRRKVRRVRRQMPMWQEIPLLLTVAFCLAVLIRTFLLQAFFIPSGSMEDTLLIGDRVLVNKIVYDVRDPARGEVVVFRGTDNWAPEGADQSTPGFVGRLGRTIGDLVGVSRPGEKDFIKRVIALPGDRVACCDAKGRVTVNGRALDESAYVSQDSPLDLPANPDECRSRRFAEVTVPAGQLWVMGDHRLVSQDARCQGPVPISNVIGRAFIIVWPQSRWATLPVPPTFAGVPDPAATAAPAGRPLPVGPDGQPLPAASADRPLPPGPGGETGALAPIVLPLMLATGFAARARQRPGGGPRRLHP